MFKIALLFGASMAALATGAEATTFGLTGQEVHYTVQTTGLYYLSAAGGNGGSFAQVPDPTRPGYRMNVDGGYGGKGAVVQALVSLDAGSVLDIFVGGHGGLRGGGGGGTFVFLQPASGEALTVANALLVAGGGGGSSPAAPSAYFLPGSYVGGSATAFGGSGNGGAGGVNPGGYSSPSGVSGAGAGGGGGGGVRSSGTDGRNAAQPTYTHATGGQSPANGGQGGRGDAEGGFGGGGGASTAVASNPQNAGGGGGFTGGNGASAYGGFVAGSAQAGTSYLRDGAQLVSATLNTGLDGFFDIELFQPTAATTVPEPSSWMTMVLGTGFVGWLLRRRRRTGAQPA